MHLTGDGVELRMRIDTERERPTEVGLTEGLEITADHIRTAQFLEGEHHARVMHDIGVAITGEHATRRTQDRRAIEMRGGAGTQHPAVAIPLRPAAAQGHPVEHALADEPVMVGGIGIDRVGTGADEPTLEHLGQRAGDLEFDGVDLIGYRCEVALEECGVRHDRASR